MPSPAERYAAAAARSRRERSEVGRFTAGLDFPLDDFQLRACQAVEEGKGVLVAAPTGAGKTIVGEFAVHLALSTGRKAFYTTPIKALSNQKYHDLVRRHGVDQVGLLTGDASVNGEAPVVVMTTEVLRNMMYAGSRTLDGLGYVVMDEVHYLADRFRGAVWEEVIIHLPEHVQVVSLSATVSNAEEFGDWLAEVRGNHEVVVSEHRPVPLFQHMLVGTTMFDLFAGNRVNPDLLHAIRTAEQRGRWDDEPRRGGGRGGPQGRTQYGGSRGGNGRGGNGRGGAGRGPGGGPGGRGFARGGRPGGGATRAEVIEELDRDGTAARHHVHLQPGRLRGRGGSAPGRRHPPRAGAGRPAHPPARRGACRVARGRGPVRPRLLRLRRGSLTGVRSAPRRDAAPVPRDRRGALHGRPHPGGVRHGDTGPRHQHAGTHGGPREARQVQRRGARRRHPRRVHPAHRARRQTRHRHRGPCRRPVGTRSRPTGSGRAGVHPHVPSALELPADVQHGGQPRRPGRPGGRPGDPRDLLRPVPGGPSRRRHRDRHPPQRGGDAGLRRGDALPPRGLPGVRRAAAAADRRGEGRREGALGVPASRRRRVHGGAADR